MTIKTLEVIHAALKEAVSKAEKAHNIASQDYDLLCQYPKSYSRTVDSPQHKKERETFHRLDEIREALSEFESKEW